ncbi:MAG: hypothetical protein IKZ57_00565 [Spirochaetia bacterium]|nr:hypothetical protein [Spirochaetia bacterium]
MADFIEWQQFEDLVLFVKGNDFFNKVTLSRDKNYNIHFCASCKKLEENKFSDVSKFYMAKLNSLTAIPNPFLGKEYILNDFICERFTYSLSEEFTITGIVLKIESHYVTDSIGKPEFENIWLLNSSNQANYDQNIIKTSSGNEHYQWGDFATEDFYSADRYSGAWAGIKLKYKSYDFLLIKSDSFTKLKSSCLRFEKQQFPTEEDLTEIINILNFIFGLTFIYIGYTKYNCKSSPVSECYISTFRRDIEQILNEAQFPVIPLRLNDFYTLGIKTTELINLIFSNVAEKTKYNFIENFSFINYARTQPAEVKIQPLAATFDNICDQYFKNRENTIIRSEIFIELKNVIDKEIDDLNVDDEQKRILKSKALQINNQSQNQRNKRIFEELGLKLSNLEEKALNARNPSIHGKIDSKNIQESILLAKCYYTLINRLILKILNISLYIDYTYPEGLPTKIEDGQYLWMENKKQKD